MTDIHNYVSHLSQDNPIIDGESVFEQDMLVEMSRWNPHSSIWDIFWSGRQVERSVPGPFAAINWYFATLIGEQSW